jgi:iron complex transport system permease protein
MVAESASIEEKYSKFSAGKTLYLLFLLVATTIVGIISICLGSTDMSPLDVVEAVFSKFLPLQTDPFKATVIWELRMPRVVMGMLAGAGLALAGTTMQGVTRNPLVSPFTIGISSAAAFGASLAIMLGLGFLGTGTVLIIANAFIFAMICTLLVFGLSRLKGNTPETIVLAGIAIAYLFGALTSLLQFFASEEALMAMVHWSFGSLNSIRWNEVAIVALAVILAIPLLMRFSWDLNVMMSNDDDSAKSMGVNSVRVRGMVLVGSSLIAAIIVCFTGIIAFVGLVAPHITRFLIGTDNRYVIPASCLMGALLLVAADSFGRMIINPLEIPIGIVISFVGVPLFIYLLMTRRERYWG